MPQIRKRSGRFTQISYSITQQRGEEILWLIPSLRSTTPSAAIPAALFRRATRHTTRKSRPPPGRLRPTSAGHGSFFCPVPPAPAKPPPPRKSRPSWRRWASTPMPYPWTTTSKPWIRRPLPGIGMGRLIMNLPSAWIWTCSTGILPRWTVGRRF